MSRLVYYLRLTKSHSHAETLAIVGVEKLALADSVFGGHDVGDSVGPEEQGVPVMRAEGTQCTQSRGLQGLTDEINQAYRFHRLIGCENM